jgi:NAD(P)-dependent dehydrogenase (short-subunit alcohol dehydrogenase family)
MTTGMGAGRKKALITGAAGGPGQAMAGCWLARQRRPDRRRSGRVQALAAAINAEVPDRPLPMPTTNADEAAWTHVVEAAALPGHGRLILVNNAGIGGDMEVTATDTSRIGDVSTDQTSKVLCWAASTP